MKTAKKIIAEWNDNKKDILFISNLKCSGLDEEAIATILVIIENTCHHCWNANSSCQCWNDE